MAEVTTETQKPKGPTLHHLNNSQSQRILWLCEELSIAYGFEYTLVKYLRDKKTHRAGPDLTKVHFLGKAPVLVTTDGRVIIESSVIASYLLKTYDTAGKFSTDDWIRDDTLASYAGANLGLFTMTELLLDMIAKGAPWPISYLTKAIQKGVQTNFTTGEFKKSFEYLEMELGDNDFFGGKEPGRSDVLLSWPFDNLAQRGTFDFDKDYPKLGAWRQRILEREAWKRGLEKGNGYKLSF